MSGGGITWFLEQARERSNARMIVIDPRYTDTAAGREDEWIPILIWVVPNSTNHVLNRESGMVKGSFSKVLAEPRLLKLNFGIMCL
ncbi:hypothetical protein MJL48_28675, partial [Salmonella enterica subsp. enterica serovar Kentucky]|nr:hypothetical protein [Salmonella enterica subsp. enterica serovar Kentucky]